MNIYLKILVLFMGTFSSHESSYIEVQRIGYSDKPIFTFYISKNEALPNEETFVVHERLFCNLTNIISPYKSTLNVNKSSEAHEFGTFKFTVQDTKSSFYFSPEQSKNLFLKIQKEVKKIKPLANYLLK
jgi:hypothetical protein